MRRRVETVDEALAVIKSRWVRKGRCRLLGRNPTRYPQIRVAGRTLRAHRVVYLATRGPIPVDRPFVLHRCVAQPSCVAPWHNDRTGTPAMNSAEMVRLGRSVRGSHHPRAKLSEAMVLEARAIRAKGTRIDDIVAHFGIVGREALASAIRGATWGWLQ